MESSQRPERKRPYYYDYPLWLIVWKPIRKFLNVVVIPSVPFTTLRVFLYRLIGFKIGKRVFIGMRCYLDDVEPHLTRIGNEFAIHGKEQRHTPIVIEDGVYVGLGAILLSGKTGITLGAGSIVGAGSVVTSSVPPGAVVAGVPAKVLRVKGEQSTEGPKQGDPAASQGSS